MVVGRPVHDYYVHAGGRYLWISTNNYLQTVVMVGLRSFHSACAQRVGSKWSRVALLYVINTINCDCSGWAANGVVFIWSVQVRRAATASGQATPRWREESICTGRICKS